MADNSSPGSPRIPSGQWQPTGDSRLATTADRDAAVSRLSSAFANDELSLEEFEHRVGAVFQAPTAGGVAQLVADLRDDPAPVVAVSQALSPATPMSPRLAVAFGSVERGGHVAMPARLDLRAVFGNIELDLREAEFGPGVTEIVIHAVIGNVEIQLPARLGIENHGDGFFGSFAARVKGVRRSEHTLPASSGSRVRVSGRAVLGNVEVEREVTGDD